MNYLEIDGCEMAYREAGHGDRTLVFLHGNSMSSEIFDAQLSEYLVNKYHLLAFDLPGHGKSGDAATPEATYTLPGYAAVIGQALAQLQVKFPLLIGFSLGGNVALQMLASGQSLAGLMTIGASPLSGEAAHLMDGFLTDIDLGFMFNETMTDAEVETYVQHALQGNAAIPADFLEQDVRRTHGLARTTLIGSLIAGDYADQESLVGTNPLPLALVFGANDTLMNTDHIGALPYANLWGGTVQSLTGGFHAPFRDGPEDFDALVDAFADTIFKPT